MKDRSPARGAATGERLVSEYLVVVREHWKTAVFVALAVFGLFVVWTLYATPVYETEATIQLSEKGAEQQVLAELSSVETSSSVETEMQVMRSYKVALGATQAFSLKKDAAPEQFTQVTALCWEKNAYRQLAALNRRLGRREGTGRLRVRTADEPQVVKNLELRFDASGRLAVVDVGAHGEPVVAINEFAHGAPFDAFGLAMTIYHLGGPYKGRTFELKIRPRSTMAAWIQSLREIETVGKKTGIARITVRAEAPGVARDIANALAWSYLTLRESERKEDLGATFKFLEAQERRIGDRLTKAVKARDEFAKNEGAFQLRARASTMTREQDELKERLAEVKREKERGEAELAGLKTAESIDELLERLGLRASGGITAQLLTQRGKAEAEIDLHRENRMVEGSEVMRGARARLAAVEKQLLRRLQQLASAAVTQLERQISVAEGRIENLDERLEQVKSDLSRLPVIEQRLVQLESAVEAASGRLQGLQDRKLEVAISMESRAGGARLVDEAQAPSERKSPQVAYMLMLGALFGLLAGVGSAFVLDALDHKVRSPDELEAELGLTTYASIPSFTTVHRKDRKALRGAMAAIEAPHSVISEAYRSLRANIRFAAKDGQTRALAITSALAGEGKTVTTLNLAAVLGQAGSTVIVVDSDMRRSTVHEYMELERAPGLTEVLTGSQDWKGIVQSTPVSGYDILTSGTRHDHPGALLDSPAFKTLLADLKESYDYVLIDMPPVLAVADAAPFFSDLDGVLLLCRAGRCPVSVYQGAMDQVQRLGGTVIGSIFNGFDARRVASSGYGYHGYYGYHAYYAYDESRRRKSKKKKGQRSPPKGGGENAS